MTITVGEMEIRWPSENDNPFITEVGYTQSDLDSRLTAVYEDRDLLFAGGGEIGFNPGTGEVSWSQDIYLLSPRGGAYLRLPAGSQAVADGQVLYVQVSSRLIDSNEDVTASVSSSLALNDDQVMIGMRLGTEFYSRGRNGVVGDQSPDMNRTYDNFVGSKQVDIDDGDLTFAPVGAYSHVFDISGATGTDDGMIVANGADNFSFLRKGADVMDVVAALQNMTAAMSGVLSLQADGAATVAAGATADLNLGARGASIPVNESGNTTLSGYTATSFVGALNEVKAEVSAIAPTMQSVYETGSDITFNATGSNMTWSIPAGYYWALAGPGGLGVDHFFAQSDPLGNFAAGFMGSMFDINATQAASIQASVGSVVFGAGDGIDGQAQNNILLTAGMSGSGQFAVQSSGSNYTQVNIQPNATNYGFQVVNGADWIRVLNAGTDQIEFSSLVEIFNLTTESNATLTIGGDYVIDGPGNSEFSLRNAGTCTLYTDAGAGFEFYSYDTTLFYMSASADYTMWLDGAGTMYLTANSGAIQIASDTDSIFSVASGSLDITSYDDSTWTVTNGALTLSSTDSSSDVTLSSAQHLTLAAFNWARLTGGYFWIEGSAEAESVIVVSDETLRLKATQDGDIIADLSEMTAVNGTRRGFIVSDGTDYAKFGHQTTNQMWVEWDVTSLIMDSAGTFRFTPGSYVEVGSGSDTPDHSPKFFVDGVTEFQGVTWIHGADQSDALLSVVQTPTVSAVHTVAVFESNGSNFAGPGSYTVKIINDDNSCWNLSVHDGSNDRILFGRFGSMWMYALENDPVLRFSLVGADDAYGGIVFGADDATRFYLGTSGRGNNRIIFTTSANKNRDHDRYDYSTDPEMNIFSAENVNDDNTEFATHRWNIDEISGGSGSYHRETSISETVTIPIGEGDPGGGGAVTTTGNLAPAHSHIKCVTTKVRTAPGGGANEFNVGITGSGNADELIDAAAVGLNTTANSYTDNDGTQLPLKNGSATTLTISTDADVTGTAMEIEIIVYYDQVDEITA